MAGKKRMRRKENPPTPHFWEVEVRHRDWMAMMTSFDKRMIMKHSTLFIICPQPYHELPNIDKALAKTRSFLRRNRRQYGTPTINGMTCKGSVDA
jgi:hypothetical protein